MNETFKETILVVDDTETNIDILADILEDSYGQRLVANDQIYERK